MKHYPDNAAMVWLEVNKATLEARLLEAAEARRYADYRHEHLEQELQDIRREIARRIAKTLPEANT